MVILEKDLILTMRGKGGKMTPKDVIKELKDEILRLGEK